jgi:hypothetical protein
MRRGLLRVPASLPYILASLLGMTPALADPAAWRQEWPRTDFSRHSVAYDEIVSGGPPKDGIPAIDNPSFAPVSEIRGLTRARRSSPSLPGAKQRPIRSAS